jgi:DNA-binding transcriptional MerR regulator
VVGKIRSNGMLTASQVAQLLKIDINTVQLWNKMGVLKLHRTGFDGERKYKREDIVSFLGKRQCRSIR